MIHNINTQTNSSLSTLNYQLGCPSNIYIALHDKNGNMHKILLDDFHEEGDHRLCWDSEDMMKGPYFIHIRMPNRRLVKRIEN